MASVGNTLGKDERLSGKKSVATLLAGGRWGSLGHFRYCWMVRAAAALPEAHCHSSQKNAHQGSALLAGDTSTSAATLSAGSALPAVGNAATWLPGRILVSVPKRYFKRAVKRNLLKRRIREAYRVQKLPGVDIMFQYNSVELADFAAIQADITAILSRIQAALFPPTPTAAKAPGMLPEGPCPSSQKNAHSIPQGPILPEGPCPSSQKNAHQGRGLPAVGADETGQRKPAQNATTENDAER